MTKPEPQPMRFKNIIDILEARSKLWDSHETHMKKTYPENDWSVYGKLAKECRDAAEVLRTYSMSRFTIQLERYKNDYNRNT